MENIDESESIDESDNVKIEGYVANGVDTQEYADLIAYIIEKVTSIAESVVIEGDKENLLDDVAGALCERIGEQFGGGEDGGEEENGV